MRRFMPLRYVVPALMLSAFVDLTCNAQPSRNDFNANAAVCGDNYYAYPEPVGVTLTPAPKGYKPVYMSHYGRHGSRWLIGRTVYDNAWQVFSEANDSNQLTPLGQRLMMQLDTLRQWAHGRDGELTPLGARQHRGIARRMYENFPELFTDGGKIEARSSVVVRCILSMTNELTTLQGLSPNLKMDIDAAAVDMAFINNKEKRNTPNSNARDLVNAFRERHFSPVRFLNSVFKSEDYWRKKIEHPSRFVIDNVWQLYAGMQGLEPQCSVDLSPYLTADEKYGIWLIRNAEWYTSHGPSTDIETHHMQRQHLLLSNIIAKADSCLAMIESGAADPVTASLRFGHEVTLMPLACVLNLNGYGTHYDDLEQLEQKEWYSYRVFPMASNIQIIFFRKPGADTLVKVMLNEHEATMPQLTPAYAGIYYKWSDVRSYMKKKIEEYKIQ